MPSLIVTSWYQLYQSYQSFIYLSTLSNFYLSRCLHLKGVHICLSFSESVHQLSNNVCYGQTFVQGLSIYDVAFGKWVVKLFIPV